MVHQQQSFLFCNQKDWGYNQSPKTKKKNKKETKKSIFSIFISFLELLRQNNKKGQMHI